MQTFLIKNLISVAKAKVNTLHLVICVVTFVMHMLQDHFMIYNVYYFSSKQKAELDLLITATWLQTMYQLHPETALMVIYQHQEVGLSQLLLQVVVMQHLKYPTQLHNVRICKKYCFKIPFPSKQILKFSKITNEYDITEAIRRFMVSTLFIKKQIANLVRTTFLSRITFHQVRSHELNYT